MIVPKRITLYCKAFKGKEYGEYPAFPVDSLADHEIAKDWATVQDYYWDKKKNKWIKGKRTDPVVFEFENKGFDNVTIVSLGVRGKGGRAYQVLLEKDNNLFRVDLREDTLMQVIKTGGIEAGGRLNGSFCFAKDGSQTKLILEGTEQHKLAIEEREKGLTK